jgi:type I restriction enzyme M protein
MGGKDGMNDSRFLISHDGDNEFSLLPRSSDGQLLFLVNKLSKMKEGTPLGSRIAEVHNGSSLFTGDAGQGESNIRRWILENDWLEAIIALPLNMFYNTGIATYIWVLGNRKPEHRRGKVQLIDATAWSQPLRKNLGKKNCELSPADMQRVMDVFLKFEETEQSKIFPNKVFGYWKIVVERPLRLKVELRNDALARFRSACADAKELPLANLLERLAEKIGTGPHMDFNAFSEALEEAADKDDIKLAPKRLKLIQTVLAVKDEAAEPVIKKLYKAGKAEADPLHGRYTVTIKGKPWVVEYEPDSDLRDTEQVPLLEDGGIKTFVQREVLPHVPDAWVDEDATKIGYEISFTRYFYKPQPLRTLEEIRAAIEAIERETDGLLDQVLVKVEAAR